MFICSVFFESRFQALPYRPDALDGVGVAKAPEYSLDAVEGVGSDVWLVLESIFDDVEDLHLISMKKRIAYAPIETL